MSGGKSIKKSVIGSRRTVMNSLNRIAFKPRKGACFIGSQGDRKLQIPSSKHQRNSKHQTAVKGVLSAWSLMFGASLELGVWSLELSYHAAFSWWFSPAC